MNLFLLHSQMSVLVISLTACRVAQLNNSWTSHCNSISHQRGRSHTGVTTEHDHQQDCVSSSLVKENESSSRCDNVMGEEKKSILWDKFISVLYSLFNLNFTKITFIFVRLMDFLNILFKFFYWPVFNEPCHFLIVAERKEVLGLRFHKAPSGMGDQIQGLPFSKKEPAPVK